MGRSWMRLIACCVVFSTQTVWAEDNSGYEDVIARIESRLAPLPGSLGKDYDELHPYYMKYCSTTKLHPFKGLGNQGTSAGHAVFYLKGACLDKIRGPSGLRLCSEDANYTSPELGVGLSIDKWLKNVNFFAFPTRTLFLGAELTPGAAFDAESKKRIIHRVIADRILSGVEVWEHPNSEGLSAQELEERMARSAFGTDYALSIARNLYCINVPFPRSVMGEVIDHLNALNDSYTDSEGEKYRGVLSCSIKKDSEYHWNAIYDNCTHTPINALATIGVIREKPTNLPFFRQLGNIAIPSHAFLDIHNAINRDSIDVDAYWNEPVRREVFLKHNWIPQTEGALAEHIPMYENNEFYKKDDHMLVLPGFFKDLGDQIRRTTSKAKYSYHGSGKLGFAPNLVHYFIKYRNALTKIEDRERSLLFKIKRSKGDPKRIAVLKSGIANLEAQLKKERSLKDGEKRSLEKQLKGLRKDLGKRQNSADYVAFVEKFKEFIISKKLSVQSQIVKVTSESHE